MAILGVPSTSIVDSTSVGRSLITASDAAAARVIMELAAVDDVTFNSVSAVDGSFSGTLDTEVGGEYRLFKLGSAADVAAGNTEYLSVRSDIVQSNESYVLEPVGTGTGTSARQFYIMGSNTRNAGHILLDRYGSVNLKYGNAVNIFVSNGYTRVGAKFFPDTDSAYECGLVTHRWSNTYSVDGDFCGDVVMAANVDFTGLPTSDPVVAGRLWNHNDTVKISAG